MTEFNEIQEHYPNLIPVEVLRAKISIIELAIQYGYELQPKKGRNRPVLQHPTYLDVIIIKNPANASQQVYQQVGNFADSGTIIDFIRHRLATVFAPFNRAGQSEFRNSISVLYNYLRIDPQCLRPNRSIITKMAGSGSPPPFAKEHFDLRLLEQNNYLHRRHITPHTLNRPEFVNRVLTQVTYYDPVRGHTEHFLTAQAHPERTYVTFNNVAFLYYNGLSTEVTGLEVRNEQIKLHAPGSDRLSSVFVSNPPPKTERFYVLESAIDALSHQQLCSQQGDDAFNSVYFSTGGQLTSQQVGTITRYIAQFEKHPQWQLRLAFDNDIKGHLYDLQFIHQLTLAKFPLRSIHIGFRRIGYALPQEEQYQELLTVFLHQIETYNRNIEALLRKGSISAGNPDLSGQLLTLSNINGELVLGVPELIDPLSAVSGMLLRLIQLNERIRIEKSSVKDYNQELIAAVLDSDQI